MAWWRQWPDANIGVATGAPSGLLVLDVDPRHGGDEALRDLEQWHGPLPQTVEALTGGGGQHIYFRCPDGQASGKLADGIDLKANGGYIVAPPSVHPNGQRYAWELSRHPDDVSLADPPPWLLALLTAPRAAAAAAPDPATDRIPTGQRNSTLTSLAGAMRRRGATQAAIESALLAENAQRCDPPLPQGEVKRIAASVARYTPADEEHDLQKDYGHAAVLATLFKDRYRWATHRGCWMAWTGAVWRPVPEEAVAKTAADELRRHYAAQIGATTDKMGLQELGKKVAETCVFARIAGALNFLKGWEGILTLAEEWDRDPWLLNVQNGTLDLRTCTLRAHDPADLLTQMAPVEYDPNAKGERWRKHLETFLPDPEVRRQVQRDLGISLVGADLEELLPIWYGTGGNGKSTTLRVLRELLGDYAEMAAPRLLIASKYERHPAELADLCGCRVLFSVEIGNGARLDEERVKALTGGENVKARFMREDFFEFPRTWTITLVCNHKPEIRGTDNGIWRRIRLIPWTVALPKEKQRSQEEVVNELLAEGPAILAWLVEGLRDWQRDHHWMADAVRVATEGYRAEQDVLGGFLADCCELGSRYTVPAATLYDRYVQWCEENSEEPIKKDAFRRMLVARGFTKERKGHDNTPIWCGLRLFNQPVCAMRPVATSDSVLPRDSSFSSAHTEKVVASGRTDAEPEAVDDEAPVVRIDPKRVAVDRNRLQELASGIPYAEALDLARIAESTAQGPPNRATDPATEAAPDEGAREVFYV
jgi:putative DNA primase/helicase